MTLTDNAKAMKGKLVHDFLKTESGAPENLFCLIIEGDNIYKILSILHSKDYVQRDFLV